MPSPFPGMNPYLEQAHLWRGFHTAFLANLVAALTPRIGDRYFIGLEESLYIDPTGDEPRLFAVADTAVADDESREGTWVGSGSLRRRRVAGARRTGCASVRVRRGRGRRFRGRT